MQVRDSAGSLQAMAERVTMKAMNLANQEMEIANQDSTIITAVNFDEIQKRFLQTSSVEPTQQVKQMMAHVAKVSSLLQKVQPQESTELLEETVDAVEMQLSLGKTMSQTEQAIRSRTNEEIPKLVRSSTVNQDAQEQLASFLGEH
jgi:DNA-binding PucR family transcriptional regulator